MNAAGLVNTITREQIRRHVIRCLHKGRSVAQADIELLDLEGGRYVLKDFHSRPPLIRFFWGRRIISREWRVYRRLQGIEGIPRVYRRMDEYAFIMEYIDGTRVPHRRDCELKPDFFERLKILTGRMHERGVTHGDIRRKNTLVTVDQRPFLIDFASAFCLKRGGNPLSRAIYRRLKKVDEITVLKIQNHLLPGTLTPGEEERLARIPWYLGLGRFLKKKIYRPLKHLIWKRKGK